MKQETKNSILYILMLIGLVIMLGARAQQWLNSEEVITVHAKETHTDEADKTEVVVLESSDAGMGNQTEASEDSTPKEEIKEKIYEVFGDDGDVAYAIAQAESRLNPEIVNSTEVEHSVGLFQINLANDYGNGAWVHADKIPGDTIEEKEAWLKVPENNILTAKFIKGSSGFHPWSVYTNKKYLKYMKEGNRQ